MGSVSLCEVEFSVVYEISSSVSIRVVEIASVLSSAGYAEVLFVG